MSPKWPAMSPEHEEQKSMPCVYTNNKRSPFEVLEPGCPFPANEAEIVNWNKKDLCKFHAPLTNDGAWRFGDNGISQKKTEWSDHDNAQFNIEILEFLTDAYESGKTVDLSGVVFPTDIDFSKIALPKICFQNAIFHGNVVFDSTQFTGNVSFLQTQFLAGSDFSQAVFIQEAVITSTTFANEAKFQSCSFQKGAKFNEAKFSDSGEFSKAVFNGDANFNSAGFTRFGKFPHTRFFGEAYFVNAMFLSTSHALACDFNCSEFKGRSIFSGADIKGQMLFNRAIFGGEVSFNAERITDKPENIRKTLGQSYFDGCVFMQDSDFSNRTFTGKTVFSNSVFHKAPQFHNSEFHQDTDFSSARFLDVSNMEAARAYRTLKLAMENHRARHEEAMFHGLEMRSRRKSKSIPVTERLFSFFYDIGSDYGQSVSRPLGWLIGVLFCWGFIYSLFIGNEHAYDRWPSSLVTDFGQGVVYATEQVVRPFSIWTSNYTTNNAWVMKWLSVLRVVTMSQTFASLGMITLFLLALRRRFKME